jgi:nitrogen regulatory protein P-II 1
MSANKEIQLIKIEAVVRDESFVDVKNALSEIGVNGITAYQVVGCGIQRGMSEYVRGHKVDVQVLPKIKFEIVVSSEEWEEKTINAIKKAAFTGEPGDGKIFSYNIRQAVKIRTGETGYDAIQSPDFDD